jgi:hypothetical protein
MAELKSMIPRTSQYHPGHEIPEKNWYYRIAKKFLFNDFGVYRGHDHSQSSAPARIASLPSTTTPVAGSFVELSVPPNAAAVSELPDELIQA